MDSTPKSISYSSCARRRIFEISVGFDFFEILPDPPFCPDVTFKERCRSTFPDVGFLPFSTVDGEGAMSNPEMGAGGLAGAATGRMGMLSTRKKLKKYNITEKMYLGD